MEGVRCLTRFRRDVAHQWTPSDTSSPYDLSSTVRPSPHLVPIRLGAHVPHAHRSPELVANVDISTAIMYQEGTLINLCLKHLNLPLDNPSALANLDNRQLYSIKRILTGLKVTTGGQTAQRPPRAITGMRREAANKTMFNLRRDGEPDTTISVAEYFKKLGRPLRHPNLPCVEVRCPVCFALGLG